MGWSSGSEICGKVLDKVIPVFDHYNVNYNYEVAIVAEIIKIFENADCDTMGELEGDNEVINDALKALHPDWYKEDGECLAKY